MDVKAFLKSTGLEFAFDEKNIDVSLFDLALTHASYSIDKNLGNNVNNERLEFYGDSVLKLACSKFLYEKYPDSKEGVLSAYRAVLVSDAYLVRYAADIELNKFLRVSNRKDLKQKKASETILACAFEAMLGAIFIQKGFDIAYTFLHKFFVKNIDYVEENLRKINAKAALQEYTQAKTKSLPEYVLLEEIGKDHEKTFVVSVLYQGEELSRSNGKSKKEAEQAAAYAACVKLGVIENG